MIIVDNQTVKVTASWDEPTTNSDAAATLLTDLAYSSVYYEVVPGTIIVGAKIPATKSGGGGRISTDLIVPAPVGGVTSLRFFTTATDLSGNESAASPSVFFNVERLTPMSPTGFSIV